MQYIIIYLTILLVDGPVQLSELYKQVLPSNHSTKFLPLRITYMTNTLFSIFYCSNLKYASFKCRPLQARSDQLVLARL
jgi:hypothetical protein